MKENKLSREEMIKCLEDVFEVEGKRLPFFKDKLDQVLCQFKSLLTPISKDKLDEFVEKMADEFDKWIEKHPGFIHVNRDWLKDKFNAYDELRRGG